MLKTNEVFELGKIFENYKYDKKPAAKNVLTKARMKCEIHHYIFNRAPGWASSEFQVSSTPRKFSGKRKR